METEGMRNRRREEWGDSGIEEFEFNGNGGGGNARHGVRSHLSRFKTSAHVLALVRISYLQSSYYLFYPLQKY